MSRASRRALAALLALGATGAGLGSTLAAFSAETDNAGNSAAAAPDLVAPNLVAPTATAAVLVRTDAAGNPQGSIPGFLRSAATGTYRVYANVEDTGNPAAGISPTDATAITSNTSTFDTGETAVALAAGSFPYGGVTYNRRSAVLTPNTLTNNQVLAFSLGVKDLAVPANTATLTGTSGAADLVAPAPSAGTTAGTHNIEAVNGGGGTAGRMNLGDTLTLRFGEPIDPISVLAGWNGAATDVTVRVTQVNPRDTLEIWPATNTGAALPLGTIDLNDGGWVTASVTFGAPGTAVRSRLTLTDGAFTLSLGTVTGTIPAATVPAGSLRWTPTATTYDRAGNVSAATQVTEPGAADVDF